MSIWTWIIIFVIVYAIGLFRPTSKDCGVIHRPDPESGNFPPNHR